MDFCSAEELRRIGSLKWTGVKPADGSDVLGAWVAEMDFGTAPCVEERMTRAIREGLLGYNPRWLEPEVAQATAHFQRSASAGTLKSIQFAWHPLFFRPWK